MCFACEQDAIWLAYLDSQDLVTPDNPKAVDALFAPFPVQPLPLQQERPDEAMMKSAGTSQISAAPNPFSCDDPTAG